jgi:hypothetical protein
MLAVRRDGSVVVRYLDASVKGACSHAVRNLNTYLLRRSRGFIRDGILPQYLFSYFCMAVILRSRKKSSLIIHSPC